MSLVNRHKLFRFVRTRLNYIMRCFLWLFSKFRIFDHIKNFGSYPVVEKEPHRYLPWVRWKIELGPACNPCNHGTRNFGIRYGTGARHPKIPLSWFRNSAEIIILNLWESSRWLSANLRSSVGSQNSSAKKTNAGQIPFCQNPRRHPRALFVNHLIIQTSFYRSRIYSFRLIPGTRL